MVEPPPPSPGDVSTVAAQPAMQRIVTKAKARFTDGTPALEPGGLTPLGLLWSHAVNHGMLGGRG
jgi:hypothetical protein